MCHPISEWGATDSCACWSVTYNEERTETGDDPTRPARYEYIRTIILVFAGISARHLPPWTANFIANVCSAEGARARHAWAFCLDVRAGRSAFLFFLHGPPFKHSPGPKLSAPVPPVHGDTRPHNNSFPGPHAGGLMKSPGPVQDGSPLYFLTLFLASSSAVHASTRDPKKPQREHRL